MTLRNGLIACAVIAVVLGCVFAFLGVPLAAFELLGGGTVVLIGLAIEHHHYQTSPSTAEWETTGERFMDPVSGHQMQVRFNPKTGERDYVDLAQENRGTP